MRKIFVFLMALVPFQMMATDYVDAINTSSTKYEAGHQVIYEMNVGAFTSAGTFNAAKDKLEDLKTLGVDIVWLMPIYPRGGGINSPYAATNFQKVNPAYGTIDDLKTFVSRAHELKMEVWLDWVPNHTATDADWVTSHPEYYSKSGNNFIHPNGYSDVYQLNYNNSELVTAMNNCLKFWVDQADIDGYRCDFVSSNAIPASYWQTTIPLIKSYKSGKTITFLGEADIANDATKLKSVGFDYDYAWQYQTSLVNYGSSGVYAASLKTNANKLIDGQNSISFGRMVYLTNHDQNYNEDKKTMTQKYGNNRYPLTVLAHTVWGMPLIYNGQEIGGNQALNYFTDQKIDWNSTDKKMLNTIRTLNALKHSIDAFKDGKTASTHHSTTWLTSSSNNVLAYSCKYGSSEAVIILNFGTATVNTTISGITAGAYSLWLNSETISSGTSRKQVNLSTSQSISLEAKGYRVYVKGNFPEEDIPAPEVYTPTIDSADEISLFFETATEANYQIWAWGDGVTEQQLLGITGGWGDRPSMTLMGIAENGHYIYKFTFKAAKAPSNFIITKNGDNPRPYDGAVYVVNGYYVEGTDTPTKIISQLTGIRTISTQRPTDDRIYTLSGHQVKDKKSLHPGIYIQNGKKFIVK
ncbi:MAG: hypothetical protein K6G46_10370 [Prevotella sp.]|nr:hypothetical protein [Prevotella sp.]